MKKLDIAIIELNEMLVDIGITFIEIVEGDPHEFAFCPDERQIIVSDEAFRANAKTYAPINHAYYVKNKAMKTGTHKLHPFLYAVLHELGHGIAEEVVGKKNSKVYREQYRKARFDNFMKYPKMTYLHSYKRTKAYYEIVAELDANIYANMMFLAHKGIILKYDKIIKKLYPKTLTRLTNRVIIKE